MRRLAAIVAGRCPRCLHGSVWRGLLAMNDPCPVCGLRFEREPGYWTGAMVASYALGVPVLFAIFLAAWLATGWNVVVTLIVADVLFLLLVPFIWRYSRVVWLHVDWLIDPIPAERGGR